MLQAVGSPQALREVMAITVASVFLTRWCNSSQQQALQLFDAFLFGGIEPGLRQQPPQIDVFDLKPKFIFRGHDTLRA